MPRPTARPTRAKLTSTGPRLSLGAIRALEQELGTEFPAGYRKLMLRTNGGVPEPGFFVLRARGKPRVAWVERLASITSSTKDSLNFRGMNAALWRWHVGGSPCPAGAVSIGSAGPYTDLLLFIAGPRQGEVWLKNWEETSSRADAEGDPEEGMTRLAETFDEFLGSLETEEEAEAAAKARGSKGRRK